MGCDIHVLTEKYIDKKKLWYNADNWRINPYFGEDKYETKYNLQEVYFERNYELFTLLADVRNYHNNIKCICEPKGVPEDISEESLEEINRWDCDGHSHSYFTLKELYDFWIKMPDKVKRTGILIGETLEKFDNEGKNPEEWCQGYYGDEKYAQRTWETEYNPLTNFITKLIERFCDIYWVFWVKKEEYKTDEKLKEAIEKYGDKFRVIFFFDN